MRVLHAVEGGLDRPRTLAARRALALSRVQPELGFEPCLWASEGRPLPAEGRRPASAVCGRPPLARWPRVAVWSESLERRLRKTKADVLHAHGSVVLGAAARLAAWRVDKPVVLELYGRAPSLPWGLPCPWNVMVARWPGHERWLRETLRTDPLLVPHGAPEEAAGLEAGPPEGTVLFGPPWPDFGGPLPAPLRRPRFPRAFARAAAHSELVIFGSGLEEATPEVISALALCPSVVAPREGGFGQLGVRDLYQASDPSSLELALQRARSRPAGPRPELLRTRRWRLVAEAYFDVYARCLAPEPLSRRLVAGLDGWLRQQL